MTSDDELHEYRGHLFQIEARQSNRAWIGHFQLVGTSRSVEAEAAAAGQHQWTPLDPAWATEKEALTNATEAAHAAINALAG